MPVPNTFGTATSAIPLSQLDANFATPITIGNTAVQLGNTVTTLNNMTLANVTISSGTITITNVAVTTANVSGTANISTLVVVGNETVGGNTTITGNITAANANVTTNLVLSGGTENGVAYLNGSKVLTTGSALTFNGTTLTGTQSTAAQISLNNSSGNYLLLTAAGGGSFIDNRIANGPTTFRNGGAFTWSTYGGSDRMTLDSSGNLLVGTTSNSGSTDKLHVDGNIGITKSNGNAPQINFDSSNANIEFVNRNSGGAKTFSWYYAVSGGGTPATLSTSGVWTNSSDARGKENISDILYGLDTVMSLQPRQYDVKSDGSHAIGFVAQEVLPVVPELVHVTRRTENDEFYGLDYGSMTAVLVKAIQEQQTLITTLTARITALEGA